MRKRVVVLGAGFGGAYTAKFLHKKMHGSDKADMILVNKNNYFLFTPLLHEVATGGVSPSAVVEPVRTVLDCCISSIQLGEVEKINLDERIVTVSGRDLDYDYLVVALGSETNFFDVEGAKENTYTLKTLKGAVDLKNRFIKQFEKSVSLSEKDREVALRFVVVGGGPTGVELAAEMHDFFYDTFGKLYARSKVADYSEIVLIEAASTTLPGLSKQLGKRSLEMLNKKNINLKMNARVNKVTPNGVELVNGDTIEAETIIWVAGIKPRSINIMGQVEIDKRGRIEVGESLQLANYPDVFVIGDMARFTNKGEDRPVFQTAQVATKEGASVANNIFRLLNDREVKPYRYKHAGDLVSLGHWSALAELSGIFFTGRFAWWLWRSVYWIKMLSTRKKIKVAVDWVFDLFAPRDISQLS